MVLIGYTLTAGAEDVRAFVNWLSAPHRLLLLLAAGLAAALVLYRTWTRRGPAVVLMLAFVAAYIAAAFDPHFRGMIGEPENISISLLIVTVGIALWLGLRRAAINDGRHKRGQPLLEGSAEDRVPTWPDLLWAELVAMIVCSVLLIVWSILVPAPLEAPADPHTIPNPSKAPWYFLGVQELLVYFDPWIAGILVPGLIIFGLCAMPYLDRNPRGNGYYTLRERPFAITVFLAGFVLLWVPLILVGTFLRGPNWSHFGPFELWDPHRTTGAATVNLSELFWTRGLGTSVPTRESAGPWFYLLREAPGLVALSAYFGLIPWVLKATVFRKMYAQMGRARYAIMMVLLAVMALVPIKILLCWFLGLKYIVSMGQWSFNI